MTTIMNAGGPLHPSMALVCLRPGGPTRARGRWRMDQRGAQKGKPRMQRGPSARQTVRLTAASSPSWPSGRRRGLWGARARARAPRRPRTSPPRARTRANPARRALHINLKSPHVQPGSLEGRAQQGSLVAKAFMLYRAYILQVRRPLGTWQQDDWAPQWDQQHGRAGGQLEAGGRLGDLHSGAAAGIADSRHSQSLWPSMM